MSMKYCCDCGCIFDDEDESSYYKEYWSDEWGDKTFHYLRCPECKNEIGIEDATKCEICGEWFHNDKRSYICDECLPKFYNSEILYEATRPFKDETKISIDSFLAEYFSATEIEDILLEKLAEIRKISENGISLKNDREICEEIIKDNEYEYDDMLSEYWRKNNGKI